MLDNILYSNVEQVKKEGIKIMNEVFRSDDFQEYAMYVL